MHNHLFGWEFSSVLSAVSFATIYTSVSPGWLVITNKPYETTSSVILRAGQETKALCLQASLHTSLYNPSRSRDCVFQGLGWDAEALMSFAWTARPSSCFSSLKLLNHSSCTMWRTAFFINNWKERAESNKNRTSKCWNGIGCLGVGFSSFLFP